MSMTKIVLADDHHVVRQGLRGLLDAEPDFSVVGEAGDGLEAVQLVERLQPNVLVLDLMMPGLNGLEVTRQVSQRSPQTRVIILSMRATEAYVLEGSDTLLALSYGVDINPAEITDGAVTLDGLTAPFDWSIGLFTAPDFAANGIADGDELVLSLAGQYLGEPLVIANTISIIALLIGSDYDSDGLANELEIQLGMDPTNGDTDGDGTPDGEEDSDGDGLADGDEITIHGTDPMNADSDADGVPDGVEVITGTDPLDPASNDISGYVTAVTVTPVGGGGSFTPTAAVTRAGSEI